MATSSPASAATPSCTGQGHRKGAAHVPGVGEVPLVIYFPAHSHQQVVWQLINGSWVDVGQGYWSCALRQGSTGAGVWRLQFTLNYCYSQVTGTWLSLDGEFGPRTKAALVKVQEHHGISNDGQYGPQTARTINHPADMQTGDAPCGTLSWAGWPGNSG